MTNSQTASQSRWPTYAKVPECHNMLLLCVLNHHIFSFRLNIISAVLTLLSCICKLVIVILTVLNEQSYSFICCNFVKIYLISLSQQTVSIPLANVFLFNKWRSPSTTSQKPKWCTKAKIKSSTRKICGETSENQLIFNLLCWTCT